MKEPEKSIEKMFWNMDYKIFQIIQNNLGRHENRYKKLLFLNLVYLSSAGSLGYEQRRTSKL